MNHYLPRKSLGIMATELPRRLPFASSDYYRQLCLLGGKYGIEVFVFSPNRIHWTEESVLGYTFMKNTGEWKKKRFPLPPIIYDRCFFPTRQAYELYRLQVRRLRAKADIRFLGNGLAGKWEVTQMLRSDPYFHPYLPETHLLDGSTALFEWLDHKQEAFLKPQGGSQGKGVLHVIGPRNPSGYYEVSGRNGRNMPVHKKFLQRSAMKQWLTAFIGERPYLIQEYLSLHSRTGKAYDVRSLVQKNGRGLWQTTGMGVRCGQPGSVTSNLHGGGSAIQVMPFLIQEFGAERAEELYQTLAELSERIPLVLEGVNGRLAELGIDFGIDRSGGIWILEVNSKPGRDIFTQLMDVRARTLSIANPIRYAGYLLQRKLS